MSTEGWPTGAATARLNERGLAPQDEAGRCGGSELWPSQAVGSGLRSQGSDTVARCGGVQTEVD